VRNPDVFSGKVPKFLSNFDSFSACSPNTNLRYNFVLQRSRKYNKLKENIFSLTSCHIVAFLGQIFTQRWTGRLKELNCVEQRKHMVLECKD
jgi:hypothetical protein